MAVVMATTLPRTRLVIHFFCACSAYFWPRSKRILGYSTAFRSILQCTSNSKPFHTEMNTECRHLTDL